MASQPDASSAVAARPRAATLAMIGTAAWVAWLLWTGASPVQMLLLLSPLVLHPLVLDLAIGSDDRPRAWALARFTQLPAAIALAIAFDLPVGTQAGALASAWIVTAALTAFVGAQRLWRRSFTRDVHEIGADAGLLFLVVGASWAVASRLGLRPLDFSDTIVLLTAVHFHYAGFVLPVLATLVARELGPRRWRLLPIASVVAVALTAIGITFSPVIELLAALLTAACGLFVAAGQLVVARKTPSGWASLLLALASVSLLFAMSLAAIWAIGEARGAAWPPIPDMISLHGTANVLGTGLLGVWGWTVHVAAVRR